MAHIATTDVQAWFELTKMTVSSVDAAREDQISSQVLSQIGNLYPDQVLTWIDTTTTPKLVKSIISMMYAGWMYDTQYSENPDDNTYADRLRAQAQNLIEGIMSGAIALLDVPTLPDETGALFFPNDVSSANCPTWDNPSDGPEAFRMGKVF